MEILDHSAGFARLGEIGITLSEDGALRIPIPSTGYQIPHDCGRKTALARMLTHSVLSGGDFILGIVEHNVWPSSENEGFFVQYRSIFGRYGTIAELPFHVATQKEAEIIENLLAMSLYFSWGAIAASDNGNVLVRTSHDEWLEVAAKSEQRLAEICAMLDEFALKRQLP